MVELVVEKIFDFEISPFWPITNGVCIVVFGTVVVGVLEWLGVVRRIVPSVLTVG